jgi:hypothetical protein
MPVRRLVIHFLPGHRLRYSVEMSSDALFDMSAALRQQDPKADTATAPRMALHTWLRGEIELLPVGRAQDRIQALCSIRPSDLQILANGRDIQDRLSQLRQELSQPILAEFNRKGQIDSVRFDPHCDTTAQGFARSLLAYLQLSVPNAAAEPAWEAKEAEPNGVFLAAYTRQAQTEGEVTLRKTKRAAGTPETARPSRGLQAAKTVTPAGALTITFDTSSGLTKSVCGEEYFATSLGAVPVAQSRNTISLVLQGQSTVEPAQLTSLQHLAEERIRQTRGLSLAQDPEMTPQQEAQIQRANLGTRTWADIQKQLARLDRSASASKDAQALLPRLKASIYLHPNVCDALQMLLLSAPPGGIKMGLTVETLRAAGHERAQRTLLAVLRARQHEVRVMALLLPALGQLEAPIPEVEAALLKLSSGKAPSLVTSTACLALGAVTQTLSQSAPERAHRITQTLLERLQQTRSTEEKQTLLLALANAAQPDTLPELLQQTQDASPQVRGVALLALGRLPGEEADRKLCRALATEADARVRLATVMATEGRLGSATVRQGMLEALQGDKDIQVRLTALNVLWNGARQQPEVCASVQNAAQHDSSEEIRKAARSLLAQQ